MNKQEIEKIIPEYIAKYQKRRLDIDEEESDVKDLYDVASNIDKAYEIAQELDGASIDVEMCLEIATHVLLQILNEIT